jgi:hypothetical protein
MTWKNPPKFVPTKLAQSKAVTPEQIAGKSEGSQQKALMVWAATSGYEQLKWLVHVPNGGTRNIREAVELKAQGVKAGVPDLALFYAVRQYHGCFIEMKVRPNKVSEVQIEWLNNLVSNGYYCAVCYSWIEAKDRLINYLEGRV